MSQEKGDAQLKKEGEKKKAKTNVTWHSIECKGSIQKSKVNVPMYNSNKMRRSGRTCYFGPQRKAGAPGTVEENPIDLSEEGQN